MAQTIRVSLPGYDALTDSNPDHFALYSDEDWVLIKEYTRGSISANSNGNAIYINLGHVPTVFAYYNDNGIWRTLTGQLQDYTDTGGSGNLPYILITQDFISFVGNGSEYIQFKYFICYDNQV